MFNDVLFYHRVYKSHHDLLHVRSHVQGVFARLVETVGVDNKYEEILAKTLGQELKMNPDENFDNTLAVYLCKMYYNKTTDGR